MLDAAFVNDEDDMWESVSDGDVDYDYFKCTNMTCNCKRNVWRRTKEKVLKLFML